MDSDAPWGSLCKRKLSFPRKFLVSMADKNLIHPRNIDQMGTGKVFHFQHCTHGLLDIPSIQMHRSSNMCLFHTTYMPKNLKMKNTFQQNRATK